MANEIPVYMITGFLEGGKTSFLKFTLQQDYFNDGSKTLLILCEEGETELDQEFMDKYHVVTETIEEESELNREYFREVGKRHKPDRVIIEYNGMWSPKNITQLPFPYSWELYQTITVLDGSTFQLYLNNIKSLAMELLTYTDMVVFNRCTQETPIDTFNRSIKAVNRRAMIDDKGRRVKEATPSMPVEILGLNDVPNAGEIFVNTENEKEARSFAETFIKENREKLLADTKTQLTLDSLNSQIKEGSLKELNLIVKADVQGSVEAVKQSLLKLSNEEVVVKIIHSGVGAINESDVSLASASNAIIIGFNIRPDAMAKSVAEREKVEIRLYRVIYQAIADVEAAMKGMLDPIYEEKVIGHAQVRQIFKASGVGNIAGSYVTDGMFQRGCKIRISREGEQIYEGSLASLKRFKDDVKEVKEGYECGLVFEKFNDIQIDDIVEAYIMEEVPR